MLYDVQERDQGNGKLFFSVVIETHRTTSYLEQE